VPEGWYIHYPVPLMAEPKRLAEESHEYVEGPNDLLLFHICSEQI
jgi:hypothetical protein